MADEFAPACLFYDNNIPAYTATVNLAGILDIRHVHHPDPAVGPDQIPAG